MVFLKVLFLVHYFLSFILTIYIIQKIRINLIQPSINGLNIKHVTSTKFFGIIIDDKLNWSLHINYVASKISKNIGVISKISSFVDRKILIMLYYSLIYPYLTYCNIAWASNYPSKLIPLLTLQKRIICIIFHPNPCAHTKDYFISNGFLNIYQINKFQTCLFIFNYEHNLLHSVQLLRFTRGCDIALLDGVEIQSLKTQEFYK